MYDANKEHMIKPEQDSFFRIRLLNKKLTDHKFVSQPQQWQHINNCYNKDFCK